MRRNREKQGGRKSNVVLGILAFLLVAGLGGKARAEGPVHTADGWVEGVQENGAMVFKGIPFAAPPVGELRWQDPQPPLPWPGVRKADRFSPISLQQGMYPPEAPPEPESEDCLYLNIWMPLTAPAGKLPVMVWNYGGALENGSASTPLYAGDKLVQRGVIVVTFNYRLGVFGFLAHPELTKESWHHSSGNYGMLDQLAASGGFKRTSLLSGAIRRESPFSASPRARLPSAP